MRLLSPSARTRPFFQARRGNFLAGCLVVLAILMILLLIAGVYVWMNWKGWAASFTTAGARELLRQSKMPEDQKQAIIAEVDSLATDFKEGRISVEEMGRVIEAVAKSPVIPLAGVQFAKEKYIDRSDMTAEEKAAANRSLQRFARGVHEKKITPADEQVTDALKPIARLKPGNQWELKDNPTRQELDQFVANCKAKADEAQVPDEPFDLNFASELKKAINQALGRTPAPPAPPPAGGGG